MSDPLLSRVLYIDLSRKKFWVEDRKDLFEIADFCKDNGIITYLSSNGLYFTKGN